MASELLLKLAFLATIIGIAHSATLFEQCAGDGFGTVSCLPGLQCFRRNNWYSSCQVSCPRYVGWECEASLPAGPIPTVAGGWDQCGGDGWYGPVQCAAGFVCYARSIYYAQCRPAGDCPSGWSCSGYTAVTTAPATTLYPGQIILETYAKCNDLPSNFACPAGTACFRSSAVYSECRPYCPTGWACETDYVGLNGQCGGSSYTGINRCGPGLTCYAQTVAYAQCRVTGDCPVGWACYGAVTNPAPATTASPYAGAYEQCGGSGWTGGSICPAGLTCYTQNALYSQCRVIGDCPAGWICPTTATLPPATTASPYVAALDQCGGSGWTGGWICPAGYTCYAQNAIFSQCRLTGDCLAGWACPTTTTLPPATTASPYVAGYDQCGGSGWTGGWICPAGYTCYAQTATFSQCRLTGDCPAGWACPVVTTTVAPVPVVLDAYAKCNGIANAVCTAGTACFRFSSTYSECRPTCPAGWACETDYAGLNEQCGGYNYVGLTTCAVGLTCIVRDASYSYCA